MRIQPDIDAGGPLWNNRRHMFCISVLVVAALGAGPSDRSPGNDRRPVELVDQASPARPTNAAQQEKTAKAPAVAEAYYLFLRGLQAETDGNAEEAIDLYQRAAKLDPSSGEIPAAIARVYVGQNRPREALAAAESALKIDPQTVEAHRILGTIYAAYSQTEGMGRTAADRLAEKDFAGRALTHLEAVLNARGNLASPELLLTLGRLYVKTSQFDKAIALLVRFNEMEPDFLDGVALLSDAYTKAGRLDDAIKLLGRGAEREPSLYPPLATALENAGRWKEAADTWAKASKEGVNSTDMRRRWAVALLNAQRPGDAGKARELLQQAVKSDPKDIRALYLLVQAQRQLNEYGAAEATARQLIAADPTGPSGPYALAQIYEQRHEPRKVVDTLQPVVDRVTPADAATKGMDITPLLLHLSLAYVDLGQPDRAIAMLERAKQAGADNATVDVALVQAHIAARRYGDAVEVAAKARADHPDDVRLARLEAEALRQTGQMDRGVAILERVRDAHPDDSANYVALAQLLLAGERLQQAASVMQDARTRFPDDLSIQFEQGAVYERQKKYDEAEKALRDVLARDPLHAPALNYLGYMLANRGVRLEDSVAYIRRALEVEPNNPAYLDSLGWAYFKMNRLALAEQNLRRASDDRPRDSAVQDHWGDLLLKLGRPNEAIAAWKRALAGDGEDIDRTAIDNKIRSATGKARK